MMQALKSMSQRQNTTIESSRREINSLLQGASQCPTSNHAQVSCHIVHKKTQFFPPEGGLSKCCCPREILRHQKLDFHKQCGKPRFSYVQAQDELNPLNSQAPSSVGCIYLFPLSNILGGHEIFHLATRCTLTQQALQLPTCVIAGVYDMATAEGMKCLRMSTISGDFFV